MNERNVIRNVKMFSKPDLVNERETRKKKKRKKKLFHKLFKKFHSIIHEHSFNERVFSHTRTYETNCTQVRSNIVNSEETNDPRDEIFLPSDRRKRSNDGIGVYLNFNGMIEVTAKSRLSSRTTPSSHCKFAPGESGTWHLSKDKRGRVETLTRSRRIPKRKCY